MRLSFFLLVFSATIVSAQNFPLLHEFLEFTLRLERGLELPASRLLDLTKGIRDDVSPAYGRFEG
jgi:hypothetical protein